MCTRTYFTHTCGHFGGAGFKYCPCALGSGEKCDLDEWDMAWAEHQDPCGICSDVSPDAEPVDVSEEKCE